MPDCCSANNKTKAASEQNGSKKRHVCPVNNTEYQQVPYSTVLQHIKKPWHHDVIQQQYYFCTDPECDVVYFGQDNSLIKQSELRTPVGIKAPNDDASIICYCFDISFTEAQKDKTLEQFVIVQTKKKHCSCESLNPSGRCCLKDFKKLL